MWVIIVGTILSFVIYLFPNVRSMGGLGSSRGASTIGTIDGEAVGAGDYENAVNQAKVFYRMRTGHWPAGADADRQVEEVAFQQLFVSAKLKELNLEIPAAVVDDFIRTDILRLKPGQAMPKAQWDDFVAHELVGNGRVTLQDFENWARNALAAEMLLPKLYGVNGAAITSKEAEFFFRRNRESMLVEWVRFPITNYVASVNPTPEQIRQFFTNQQANYRLPEREVISYVHYNPSNYVAVADDYVKSITNFDDQIEKEYLSRDISAYKDTNGNQLSADAAKAMIREGTRLQVMVKAAATNAQATYYALMQGHETTNNPITKADLEKFAATNNLKLITSAPFDQQNPPEDIKLTPAYLDVIFHLDLGDPGDQYKLIPAAIATNGFYLVGLEKKIPSESQTLEAVQAKVVEDFRNNEAAQLAAQDGAKFEAAVKAGLAKGQTFDAICEAQKFKPQTLTPFSLDTTSIPEIEDQSTFEMLARMVYDVPTGQCSEFNPYVPGGGFVAYVQKRTPVDETIVQRDLPTYLHDQRLQREQAAFNIWFGRQYQVDVKRTTKPGTGTGAS